MTDLRSALLDYLRVRRALGHKLKAAERLLGQFVAYCEASGTSTVTTEIAVTWASLPVGADASWFAQRLSMVRCFATWVQTIDPATQVPPTDILTGRQRRAVPYLYTDDEVCAIMAATRILRSPMQQQTYRAVVGMLAVTGLRVGEAIRLGSDDVCLRTCIVRVIGTKFGKSREVPLDPSSAEALGAYVESRDLWWPQPCDESFFLSTTGTTLSYSRVRSTFQTLVQRAGLRPRDGRCRPRLHDLRHTVACKILVEWHRDGLDVQSRLPLLSTFLGHGKPEDTYWYLSAVPELLGQVARRLEDTFEDGR